MLPNFLVIGAEKSGTTWLYHNLKQHPQIFLPETKEIHYFNARNSNLEEQDRYSKQNIDWYESFFRNASSEKAVGEITPMYICDEHAYKRIHETLGEVKLIVMLRNPIDRAYSHYWMARWKGHVNDSFKKIVETKDQRFIQRGLYGEQLERYYKLWSPENTQVLIFDNFFENKNTYLKKIFDFLEIDESGFLEDHLINHKIYGSGSYKSPFLYKFQKETAKFLRKFPVLHPAMDKVKKSGLISSIENMNRDKESYPAMPDELRSELRDYYSSDIDKLEQLVGINLSIWKESSEH